MIPFHKPNIGEEEINEVIDTLKSEWLTTGAKVDRFEKVFSEFLGVKHSIAVNSCTAALHLALEAVGLQKDDAVITTPMTFASTAEVIHYFDAIPAFVDIDYETMNLNVKHLERRIEDLVEQSIRIKAIIPVHYAGQVCDMEEIVKIAEENNLKVIEDAAHAFPARIGDKNVGCIGDITCFSFYATKTITTGEGGMITTDNDEYAERMRIMSLHGISKDAWNRYSAEGNWYYEILAPGFKYNLGDVAASLGIVQLKKAEFLRQQREKIALRYNEVFSTFPQLSIPYPKNDFQHSWHLYVIKLDLESIRIDRAQFIDELKKRGIGTSVHFIPLHIHPYYRNRYGYKPEDFPVAYDCYKRIISLPIYPGMTDQNVNYVIEAVAETLNTFKK